MNLRDYAKQQEKELDKNININNSKINEMENTWKTRAEYAVDDMFKYIIEYVKKEISKQVKSLKKEPIQVKYLVENKNIQDNYDSSLPAMAYNIVYSYRTFTGVSSDSGKGIRVNNQEEANYCIEHLTNKLKNEGFSIIKNSVKKGCYRNTQKILVYTFTARFIW